MVNTPITGAFTTAVYGFEGTFGTAASSRDKPFGHDIKLSGLTYRNNNERLYDLGDIQAKSIPPKAFNGSVRVEGVLGNGFFWRLLTGNASTDAGAGPYTHTYMDGSNPATIAKTCPGMSIAVSNDLDTDNRDILLGGLIKNYSLNLSVGEYARFGMDVDFIDMDKDTTLTSAIPDTYAGAFTYAHGTLQIPTSTTQVDVQSCEVNINRNWGHIEALGSRHATNKAGKQAEYTIKTTLPYETVTLLESMLGGTGGPALSVSEIATLDFTISNGLSSTNLRKHQLEFAGLQITEFGRTHDVREVTMQDITLEARQWSKAIYTDNTASAL